MSRRRPSPTVEGELSSDEEGVPMISSDVPLPTAPEEEHARYERDQDEPRAGPSTEEVDDALSEEDGLPAIGGGGEDDQDEREPASDEAGDAPFAAPSSLAGGSRASPAAAPLPPVCTMRAGKVSELYLANRMRRAPENTTLFTIPTEELNRRRPAKFFIHTDATPDQDANSRKWITVQHTHYLLCLANAATGLRWRDGQQRLQIGRLSRS
jgi:hypothetical protein